jgi:hypothetical protein
MAPVGRLAAEIAGDALADEGLVPLTRLGTEGIVARVVQELRGSGAPDRYEVVSDKPGFARAVATTVEELRLGLVSADRVEKAVPGLSVVADRYAAVLAEAHSPPSRSAARGANGSTACRVTRALRRPERILSTLSELAPMSDVVPVDLHEVRPPPWGAALGELRDRASSGHGRPPAASRRTPRHRS